MYCIHCGSGSQPGGVCTVCGRLIPHSIEEAAAAAAAQAPAPAKSPYYGIGGWLLLFCIGATVLSPLFIGVRILDSWDVMARAMESNPTFRIYGLAVYAAYTLLVISSVFAGLALWTKNRDALRAVTFFFVMIVLTLAVEYGFPYLLPLSKRVTDALWKDGVGQTEITRSGIYLLVWVSYFKKSRRVRNTFGRNL